MHSDNKSVTFVQLCVKEFASPLAAQAIYSLFKGNPEDNLPSLQTYHPKLFNIFYLRFISDDFSAAK